MATSVVLTDGTTPVTIGAALPAGTNNIGDVDVLTLPAIPAGTNNIGDVDVLTVPADPFGVNADASSATGSISAKLRFIAGTGIPVTALPTLPAGVNNIGDVDVLTLPNVTLAAGTNTNEVVGDVAHDAVIAGNPLTVGGVASAAAPTDVSADQDAVRAWYLRNGAQATVLTAAGALVGGDATNGLDVDVTRLPALVAGTANIGDVDVLTVPADPFGVNADAASATGSISAKLRFIAGTGIPITGTVTVASHAVTNAGTFAVQSTAAGDVASDGVDSGNPVKVGAIAKSADITAVADADRVNLTATLLGKLITVPYATPALVWSYAAAAGGLVTTTGVTIKTAGAAGVRNYVTSIQMVNSHQTISTEVVVRDGAAGAVLWRGWAQAAGGGVAGPIPVAIRGTAATLLEVAEVTTTGTAGVLFNAQGYTAAE